MCSVYYTLFAGVKSTDEQALSLDVQALSLEVRTLSLEVRGAIREEGAGADAEGRL